MDSRTINLNLGCGAVTPAGWTNVDYALGARLSRVPILRPLFSMKWDRRIVIHDLTKPFRWLADSAEAVYSSHTLEHFDREAGARFLAECHRVLRPGGVCRIIVPDLAVHLRRYHDGTLPAERLLEEMDVLYPIPRAAWKRPLVPLIAYPHRCMYDTAALTRAMSAAGFECRSRAPFESLIPDIRAIELEDRTRDAVIVEGIKV
jgi:predicted SAM-dependent methyltransferase